MLENLQKLGKFSIKYHSLLDDQELTRLKFRFSTKSLV